jgi:hypothetical protein
MVTGFGFCGMYPAPIANALEFPTVDAVWTRAKLVAVVADEPDAVAVAGLACTSVVTIDVPDAVPID